MTKRVMIYGASIRPGDVTTFTKQLANDLHKSLPDLGWQFSILAKTFNAFNQSIDWPETAFDSLIEQQTDDAESVYANADLSEFRQLVGKESKAFDVLYLPSPWGNLPLGTTIPIPAPVVMSIHDLEFEDIDYGIITDQHRREAAMFAKVGSAFVFSSEYVRDRAISLYKFDRDRTYVIPLASTVSSTISTASIISVRQKYNLPEHFAFAPQWLSRRQNGAVIIEALGILKDRGVTSLPLVTINNEFDDVLPQNIAHQRYGEQVQKRILQLGLEHIIQLNKVDDNDIPALIAAAAMVISPSLSEAGLSYQILNTMALGTPLIHSRIPALSESFGHENTYALSFDPHHAEDLADQITSVLNDTSAANLRATKAQAFVSKRTQADVTSAYIDIFNAVSESPWKSRPRRRDHVMRSREERVAWLINHTTLRDAELPIIRQFGLEVYTSKALPAGNEYRTASVDFSEDEHSTLPNWVIDRLNQHNFYEDGVTPEIAELLNGYFGTVITASFFPPIRDLVRVFDGRILVRVFGREHPHNYSEYFTFMGEDDLWKKVWQIKDRFWFTPSYDSIAPIEEKLLQDRTVMLPLALPDRILRASNRWVGTDKRILFICPRIESVPNYYGMFYREFKAHLGDLPHLIGGHQPIPVDDPTVTGFVSDDEMQSWFRELRVMFYHSREPRHLHYHPLEAVAYGMPLIYLTGGLVEELMGKGKPGACETYEEAKVKLQRVLDGDEAFINSVIESQQTLLETFRPEYVAEVWKERFFNIIMSTSTVPDVLPYAKWKLPESSLPEERSLPAPSLNRHIGIYALVVSGGGIYKYVTGLVQAAVKIGEPKNWIFDLIWGSPVQGQGISAPKWEFPTNIRLPIISIKRKKNKVGRSDRISYWRLSPLYFRSRFIRFASESVLIPFQYLQGVVQQRTLRPRNSKLRAELMYSRMGRRILSNPILGRLFREDIQEVVSGDYEYLTNPPTHVPPKALLEIESPPAQPYLRMDELASMTKKYDAILLANPFRLISPNTPINQATPQPVAITMYDLAHEFTEVWGPNAASVSREMALWGKIAKKIIFGSAYIRNEAIKRYNIPPDNTQIVRPPPLVVRRERPDQAEIDSILAKHNLPKRYIFNTGYQGTHKNNIAIFQALQILRWRKFDTPPFVIGGVGARSYLTGEIGGRYAAALLKVIEDAGFVFGKDIIILDFIHEDDLPAIYAGASIGISMSRSESTVHGMITESMLYGSPVIASTIPQNVEELGREDEFALLVPADDPVALADAIVYTLSNSEATKARMKQADNYIGKKTWEHTADEFIGVFEEIATARSQQNSNANAKLSGD